MSLVTTLPKKTILFRLRDRLVESGMLLNIILGLSVRRIFPITMSGMPADAVSASSSPADMNLNMFQLAVLSL